MMCIPNKSCSKYVILGPLWSRECTMNIISTQKEERRNEHVDNVRKGVVSAMIDVFEFALFDPART